jgi:exodeoxyribonuclease VII large subunit
MQHAGAPVERAAQRLRAARPAVGRLAIEPRDLQQRLARAMHLKLERHAARLERLHAHLEHLDPRQVLERGYSIVRRADGSIVRAAAEVARGEQVGVEFARGSAQAIVKDIDA